METTQLYQHCFDDVEQYLHHRSPYLLVERIQSCSTREIVTEKHVKGDEFFLQGHFPGAPIFPGAMMQELTTQTAGILIASHYNPMETYNTSDPHFNEYALGVLVKVHQARYRGFVRPGDLMVVHVTLDEYMDNLFDFLATITVDDRVMMRNSFRLTNIKSSVLSGDDATG